MHFGEPMPWEFWRVHLAKTFGQTPASVGGWPVEEFFEAIHVLNAITNAEQGGQKAP